MSKKARYAKTVMSGESPLIVCTSDTGIRDMASEFRMCPPIWNAVSGSVAMMMSLLGFRIPFLSTGMSSRTVALRLASHEKKIHQNETSKNWTMVRVTGLGRAVRMALDEVLVMMEVKYHTPQSILTKYQHSIRCVGAHKVDIQPV